MRSDSLNRPRVEMKLTQSLLAVPYLPYLLYYYCIGLSSLAELILASSQKSNGTTRRTCRLSLGEEVVSCQNTMYLCTSSKRIAFGFVFLLLVLYLYVLVVVTMNVRT